MMQLLNPIRQWFWRVKLNLIELEIVDTHDDMADALHQNNLGLYRGLADFHTALCVERLELRRKLGFSPT